MNLITEAAPFLDFLSAWEANLTTLSLNEAISEPEHTAIISIDVINGFCYQGPLSSSRVANIVNPIAELFQKSWDAGLRDIVLVQDTHNPEAEEFAQWPAHCVRGTYEAETVQAIKDLSFYNDMVVISKNSINPALNTGLDDWQSDHPGIHTYIITGDCTDLCTYQLAMHMRLQANASQIGRQVILPANCTDTYDMPLDTARSIGALPHPANLLHLIFLYHMALNGVNVVNKIE